MKNNSLIQILGTTSSGKSELAVNLALSLQQKGFRSLVISCDSRQVYKELDLGTGKIPGQHIFSEDLEVDIFCYRGIDHTLIDYIDLEQNYSLYQYLIDYLELIERTKKKIDYYIVTGGTGLYAKAIYEEYQVRSQEENNDKDLEDYSTYSLKDLQQKLTQSDFNNSDWHNSRRLITRIKNQNLTALQKLTHPNFLKKYKFAIKYDQEVITDRIYKRIIERIQQGMLIEIEQVFIKYGYVRLVALGLEYKYGAYYYNGLITEEEFVNLLYQATKKYTKRQLTWLKKEKDLIYINTLEDISNIICDK